MEREDNSAKKRKASVASLAAPVTTLRLKGPGPDAPLDLKAQALKIVTEQELLDAKEKGCLWFLTSKGLTQAVYTDVKALWRSMLVDKFGKDNADLLLQRSGKTAEECFRKLALSNEVVQRPVPRLQYHPSDYLFVIHVYFKDPITESYRGDGAEEDLKWRQVVPGEGLSDFFYSGHAEISFAHPLWTKTKRNDMIVCCRIKVDLWRLPDNKYVRNLANKAWDCSLFMGGDNDIESWGSVSTLHRGPFISLKSSHRFGPLSNWFDDDEEDDKASLEATPAHSWVGDQLVGFTGVYLSADFESFDFPSKCQCTKPALSFAHYLEASTVWDEDEP